MDRRIVGGALTRRLLLQGLAAGAAAAPAWAQAPFKATPFTLGVASGDPSPDGFVIWTRLAPDPMQPHGGMPLRPIPVGWEIAADERFRTIVKRGEEIARPEFAHAVHAEIAGLQAHRPYWYRFTAPGVESPIGRTRTAPAPDVAVRRVRLAAVGCQNYEHGLYTAYRKLSEEDLDFVFHYGDYIYENAASVPAADHPARIPIVRQHAGEECFTLDDYRRRYAQYKSDPDLIAAHAAAPFFAVNDDHEVQNNWAGLTDQNNTPPEYFWMRRAMAYQAYYEHMPFRRSSFPTSGVMQIYRRASWGDLLDAHFLDTRQFRTDQPCDDGFKLECPGVNDPNARMMSPEEEQWLYRGLASGRARWSLIAQQVMMMDIDRRTPKDPYGQRRLNMDSWAGYETPRHRLLNHLVDNKIDNVVVLTGDEHQNYAGDLHTRNGTDGPIATSEFVATSISSGGDGPGDRPESAFILSNNPNLKLINDKRGYLLCEATPSTWRAEFKIVDKVSVPNGTWSTRAAYAIEHGRKGIEKA